MGQWVSGGACNDARVRVELEGVRAEACGSVLREWFVVLVVKGIWACVK